jgi:hypothetical protein
MIQMQNIMMTIMMMIVRQERMYLLRIKLMMVEVIGMLVLIMI